MVNGPFSPSSGGRISTDLYDFYKHIRGEALNNGNPSNHTASVITASPGVGAATDVQTSIDNINLFIASMADIGKGFVAIPDGYNSYVHPDINYYFTSTIPPLNDFLTPLFAAILAGDPLPSGYERLKDGGILYIPGGVYYITSTVSVPPGIVLLGEGYATQIINATSLNVATSPPSLKLSPTPASVFLVKADPDRSTNDYITDSENHFMFSKSTKFINLTIGDNFISPTLLGDYYYNLPQNTIGDVPLIMQEQGSSLEIDNIKMLGRVINSSPPAVDTDGGTRFAIKLDTGTVNVDGTFLKITNSFIDGFEQPISFNTSGGINDYLEVTDCKVRAHGYLNNDFTDVANNCIINMNDNNALISNNNFYGNHDLLNSICYINDRVSTPVAENKSNIIVTSNQFSVGRDGAMSAGAFGITVNPTILSTPSAFSDNATTFEYGNVTSDAEFKLVLNDNYKLRIDDGVFTVTSPDINLTGTITVDVSAPAINIISSGVTTIGDGATTAINLVSPNLTSSLTNTTIDATGTTTINSDVSTVIASPNLAVSLTTATIDVSGTTTINSDVSTVIASPNLTASLTTATIDVSGTITLGSIAKDTDAIDLVTKLDGGLISLGGGLKLRTQTISEAAYGIDEAIADNYLFVDTVTINDESLIALPTPQDGRILTIKDSTGGAGDNNIILYTGSVTAYPVSNYDANYTLFPPVTPAKAMSLHGNNGKIYSCKFYIREYGTITGSAYAKIYAHSGTFGVDGVPSGAALATSDALDVATLTASYKFRSFYFSGANRIVLNSGTDYFVSIEYTGGDASNYIEYGGDSTSPSYEGNGAARSYGTWTAGGGTAVFAAVTHDENINIEGLNSPYTIVAPYSSINLISDGSDWFII